MRAPTSGRLAALGAAVSTAAADATTASVRGPAGGSCLAWLSAAPPGSHPAALLRLQRPGCEGATEAKTEAGAANAAASCARLGVSPLQPRLSSPASASGSGCSGVEAAALPAQGAGCGRGGTGGPSGTWRRIAPGGSACAAEGPANGSVAATPAGSPGLWRQVPGGHGTAGRRHRHRRCFRRVSGGHGWPEDMWRTATAAAPSPLMPFAVRQLHGRGGGSCGGGGERRGPARSVGSLSEEEEQAAGGGGRTASGGRPSRGAAAAPPREEGLGAPMEVFDRALKSLHRDRSALLLDSCDPLLGAVTERLLDRLEDCRRSFPTAVVLGGAALPVLHQLAGGRAGIERVVVVDSSQAMLDRVKREEAEAAAAGGAKAWPKVLCVRGDEEHLPLRPRTVDLIISCLGLHWANDLPGAMAQCRMALVPDGLFLGAVLGGDTLQELRISCALAQMEREGGVSAVVSPLAQVRDAGNLLTRADLRLPAVDVDRFRIGYPSPLELVQHLRALGESNAALRRRQSLSRDSALAAAAVYQSMFGSPEDGGSVSATFEVIFMTGWAPSASQPKAAKRGSATVSFQDLADGLVKGGAGVGGTADDGVILPAQPPPPSPPPPGPPGAGDAAPRRQPQ